MRTERNLRLALPLLATAAFSAFVAGCGRRQDVPLYDFEGAKGDVRVSFYQRRAEHGIVNHLVLTTGDGIEFHYIDRPGGDTPDRLERRTPDPNGDTKAFVRGNFPMDGPSWREIEEGYKSWTGWVRGEEQDALSRKIPR